MFSKFIIEINTTWREEKGGKPKRKTYVSSGHSEAQ